MDVAEIPQAVPVAPKGPIVPTVQPIGALADLDAPLDDNAVRQALMNAVANNQDPMSVTMSDLAQVSSTTPAKVETPSQPAPVEMALEKIDVPEKFLKADGAVDVEKLQASTKQLDEAVKAKEAAVQKTVDDYLREYRGLEDKFRNLPNPTRLAADLPPPPPQPAPLPLPQQMNDQQLREIIQRDYQVDPIGTTAQLIELAIQQKLEPIHRKERESTVRENLAAIAKGDPRVLDQRVFDAINVKLAQHPEYRALPNPHRTAWLEVKEDLHLGELSQAQAQPSKLSPVLGGGTPPSAPSTQPIAPQNVIGHLDRLDLRDRTQEAAGDEAIRAMLSRHR